MPMLGAKLVVQVCSVRRAFRKMTQDCPENGADRNDEHLKVLVLRKVAKHRYIR